MFISKLSIKNYRIFNNNEEHIIDGFNVPNNNDEGSGLTIFVGENGCGKTTLLDAISLCVLEYKAEAFNISDMADTKEKTEIKVIADNEFNVAGTFPNTDFKALGFRFKGGLRSRGGKTYLSTPVVYDQLFLKVDPNKPKDNSPDLRLSVNNPFSGKRFNDTDILYLDKNRLFQTRSGTYNSTRFDRIMNDFNFQYIKNSKQLEDLNKDLNEKIKRDKIENKFLEDAINEFENLSSYKVQLDFIDNYNPFKGANFIVKKANNQQLSLSSLGSGYEMLFSLIYSYYMSIQNEKKINHSYR